ncbi:MAG: hypothetical protein VYA30_09325 [Myxococcota bacterium]|nr:hypothetical protein [Myxococcota bacterium]
MNALVGGYMKVLALFASSGVLTATLAGGKAAIILGNLAVLAAAGALVLGTLAIEKAPRE